MEEQPNVNAEALEPAMEAPIAAREERSVRRSIPCDVYESDDRFVLIGELPGVAREALTVDVQGSTLYVRADRRIGGERTRFERSFALPDAADVDQVQATLQDGLVRLEIGKTQRSRPRRIPVT